MAIGDISYLSALGAGAVSFLSPCVLPLVPPYLCYMAGISVDEFRNPDASGAGSASRRAVMTSSLFFTLGFATVFVALGASATSIGMLLRTNMDILSQIGGLIIILTGLNFLGVIRIPFLSREARFQGGGKPATLTGAYVMGLAFAFGWTPCIGPILGAILTVSATSTTPAAGVALLAIYSLGLAIPFLLTALLAGGITARLRRLRSFGRGLQIFTGLTMVAMGLAMMTGRLSTMAFWLLETFPILALIG